MNPSRDLALIEELRALPDETPWLEFKHNNTDPDMIGKRCSALSNAARIEGRDSAYMLWGIADGDHAVVGTDFRPDADKVGGQVLQLWLANKLQPSPAFSFRVLEHPAGRVVLLEIPAAPGAPVSFQGVPYIRIGSATPKLLDYSQYFRLTQQPLPDNRAGIFDKLEADRLIVRDVGERWNITNLGAILFASCLGDFDASLARKGVRFVAYAGKNRAATVTHRHDGQKGYAVGFEGLVGYINALLPKNEHIGQALREAHPLFPELAIRELVANALIHQDMTLTGAGPQIELFEDRIEIGNPGAPLVKPERMVDLPPRSRNEALASLMRRMKMCEEQGSGLDKVLEAVELFQLPPLLLRAEENSMQAVLYGPRSFADMTREERVRACYFHAVLKFLSGDKMKNASLCARLGIAPKNAAQATTVINKTLEAGLIRVADPDHPRAGYVPHWA